MSCRLTSLCSVLVVVLSSAAFSQGPGEKAKQRQDAPMRELHVVGLYEGERKSGDRIHGDIAAVEVNRPGKTVTLVLSAYNQLTWNVAVTRDTKIEKVILCGYYRQRVVGLPEKVPVVEAFYDEGKGKDPFRFGYKIDAVQFRAAVRRINGITGQEIASFYGKYEYRHGKPIAVDAVQNDPRLSSDYPQVANPKDLPDLQFKAMRYVMAKPEFRHDFTASYGDFTLKGPKLESLKTPPKGVKRVAFDPVGKKWYGIAGHGVVEVDWEKQTTTAMDLGFDVPRLSWPSDITFDTKRERLLVKASYLYAFSPRTGKRSVLAEKIGVNALTYHPKHDALYGVKPRPLGGEEMPMLVQFNSDGAVVKKTTLSAPMYPGCLMSGPGISVTQIVPAGDYVVILSSPDRLESGPGLQESYLFLVDPMNGKVQLGWKGK